MKKTTKPAQKSLLLSTETVRDLKPLTDTMLKAIAGGAPCMGTRPSGP